MTITTYTADLKDQLPALPIPDLERTLSHLKTWLAPLLTANELVEFTAVSDQFAKKDGPILQERLKQLAQQSDGSWLAPIWQRSYLASREPLQSSSNFAFTVNPNDIPRPTTTPHLAAEIIAHLTATYLAFASGQSPIDRFPNGDPQDMSYYLNFFKSMRLAKPDLDGFHQGDPVTAGQVVTVIYHGHIYLLQVTNEHGQLISVESLEHQLTAILVNTTVDTEFPGMLTGLPRDAAASQLSELIAEPENRQLWSQVADSLFTVSLLAPPADQNYLKDTLLGVTDRFVDKALQVVIYEDHHVGFAIEHSRVDGVPALNLIGHAISGLTEQARPLTPAKPPQTIRFNLPTSLSSQFQRDQETGQRNYQRLAIDSAVFTNFGKSALKQHHVSPDAFFHIALALSMYRLTNQWRSIYEPVSMRRFYQGRTENARSLSNEKKQFIEGFLAAKPPANLKETFDEAVKAHTTRIHDAQDGNGVERHLLGLETVYQADSEGLADAKVFFALPQLKKLRTDYLSTTSIPFPVIQGLSFAPTSEDGYGVYYGILSDEIRLSVSSWADQSISPHDWLNEISRSLTNLMQFLEAN